MQQFLAELPGQLAEPHTGGRFREQHHMRELAVQAPRREEAFFESPGEIEAAVGPDLGNGPGGKEEQCPAIGGLANARSDELFCEVGGEQGEGRFVLVLGEPGDAPGVLAGIGRGVEQHDHAVERAPTGGEHLDVQIAGVEVAEGLAEVESIAETGGEFLGAGQVEAHEGPGAIFDVAPEFLDRHVLGGPAAVRIGVPPLGPLRLFFAVGVAAEFERPPFHRGPFQPTVQRDLFSSGESGAVQAECQRGQLGRSREGILAGGLDQRDGEAVARHLPGRQHEGVQVGRHPAFDERQVPHVLEVQGERLGRELAGPAPMFLAIAVAGRQQQRLHPVDGEIAIVVEIGPRLLVETSDVRQFSQEKQQRRRADVKPLGWFDVVVDGGFRGGVVRLAKPWPVAERAETQDRAIPAFKLPEPRRLCRNAGPSLVGRGRGEDRQQGCREQFQIGPLDGVGVGEDLGVRFVAGRFEIDVLARNVFRQRCADGGDKGLAGVDRDVTGGRQRLGSRASG